MHETDCDGEPFHAFTVVFAKPFMGVPDQFVTVLNRPDRGAQVDPVLDDFGTVAFERRIQAPLRRDVIGNRPLEFIEAATSLVQPL